MKKRKSRLCILFLCLCTVLALCPAQVLASGPVDTGAKCSLKIAFTPENTPASGVKFKAYKVASVTAGCVFEAEAPFAEQSVMQLLDEPDTESYSQLAATLPGIIASDSTIQPDSTAVTDASGIASFWNMETGLYLVVGEIYHGKDAFYTPQSAMVCLPERLENDAWDYDVSAQTKWEKRPDSEQMDLQVLKAWSDSAANLHTNDRVTVELYQDGVLFDTQTLDADSDWSYTWEGLDSGIEWTVKEQEVSGYIGTVERQEDCFVITNTAKSSSSGGSGTKLPNTGLLWWPVPMLFAGGLLFIVIGLCVRRKGKANEIQ